MRQYNKKQDAEQGACHTIWYIHFMIWLMPKYFKDSSVLNKKYQTARDAFPRKLIQPEGSFRFSIDALLLASFLDFAEQNNTGFFTERSNAWRFADLGTGCGVVALGMLLRFPEARAVGIEKQSLLAQAAKKNAELLGFSQRFDLAEVNLQDLLDQHSPDEPALALAHRNLGQNQLVLANPPYRILGTGRLPKSTLRQEALFGHKNTLDIFCKAAFALLMNTGRFGIIFPYGKLDTLRKTLQANNFFIKRTLLVQTLENTEPSLVLIEAVKQLHGNSEITQSLTLHKKIEGKNILTKEAVEFCPFLHCNAKS